jgi:hypothetical protein
MSTCGKDLCDYGADILAADPRVELMDRLEQFHKLQHGTKENWKALAEEPSMSWHFVVNAYLETSLIKLR